MPEKPIYLGGNPIVTDKVMRERHPHDFYETEPNLVTAYFHRIDPLFSLYGTSDKTFLDVGAGRGVWGKVLRRLYPHSYIAGVEIQEQFTKPSEYNAWFVGDLHIMDKLGSYEVIVGNPPYKYAEDFYWHSAQLLPNGTGEIIFLLRLGFLASRGRYDRMYNRYQRPWKVTVLNTRPSFTGDGHTYPDDFNVIHWKLDRGVYMGNTEMDFMVYER